MAGIRMLTNMEPQDLLKTAKRVAKRLDFAVGEADDWELIAQRGNFVASIFLGAFIAYCNFRMRIFENREQRVEIEIERNSPWWTGAIGIGRVKSWAKSLADGIEEEIRLRGSNVLGRKEF
ncbi:MAG: hypothetical protein IT429_02285 [Gemmataceae bacterium]|nr:hypothetical protein [Gemmataceae bacterium]